MLTEFHKAALSFMLDDPADQHLREQIPYLSLVETEHTGVGCFYTYEVSPSSSLKFDTDLEYLIDLGKTLYAKEFSLGASMILYVSNGKIDGLGILAHGDRYPETEPTEYRFENTPYNIIDLRDIQQ